MRYCSTTTIIDGGHPSLERCDIGRAGRVGTYTAPAIVVVVVLVDLVVLVVYVVDGNGGGWGEWRIHQEGDRVFRAGAIGAVVGIGHEHNVSVSELTLFRS